jgi:hypothetical protein
LETDVKRLAKFWLLALLPMASVASSRVVAQGLALTHVTKLLAQAKSAAAAVSAK